MITVTPYSYLSQEPTSLLQGVFGHNPLITSVEMHNTVLKRFLVIILNKACHIFLESKEFKKWKKKGKKKIFVVLKIFLLRGFFCMFFRYMNTHFSPIPVFFLA